MTYITINHIDKAGNLKICAIEIMDNGADDPWGFLEAFEPEMYDLVHGLETGICEACPRCAFEPYDADALREFLEE